MRSTHLLGFFVPLLLASCNPLVATPQTDANFTAGAPAPTPSEGTRVVPAVVEIQAISSQPSAETSINFDIVFNVAVSGLSVNNLTLTTSGSITSAAIQNVSGSGTRFRVAVLTGTGDGTLRLDLSDTSGIVSADGVAMSAAYTQAQAFQIIKSVPSAPTSLSLQTPASSPSVNPTPTLRIGGLTSGTTIKVFGDSLCSTTALASGTASATTLDLTLSTLTEGSHNFYATAANIAGASACSTATVSYQLDTTAPSVTGLADDATAAMSKSWTWGCSEASCTYRWLIDTQSTTAPTGAFSATTTASQSSGDAVYYLHVQARDAVGNVSVIKTVSVQLFTEMTLGSATVPATGDKILITTAGAVGTLTPASSITGFSAKVNGSAFTVSSVSRTGTNEVTIALSAVVSSADTVTLSYSGGNLHDSATFARPLTALSNEAVTNNSDWDSDAVDYFRAVTTNGGSTSSALRDATQTFVLALKDAGVWSKLLEIYPLAGDQLAAALVKLKHAGGSSQLLTNHNFTSTDYVATGATGGLRGNGVDHYLDTGLSVPSLTSNDLSIGAYVTLDSTGANPAGAIMGSSYTPSGDSDRNYLFGNGGVGALVGQSGLGSLCPAGRLDGIGFRLMGYNGGTFVTYKDASLSTQGTGTLTWKSAGTVFLFHIGGGFWHDGRIAFAFVGNYLTSTEVADLRAAVVDFATALDRDI